MVLHANSLFTSIRLQSMVEKKHYQWFLIHCNMVVENTTVKESIKMRLK